MGFMLQNWNTNNGRQTCGCTYLRCILLVSGAKTELYLTIDFCMFILININVLTKPLSLQIEPSAKLITFKHIMSN